MAADRAQLDLIGYSPDGRYFAFEQYGVQDGSGFAYADVFVIDLPADKWTYGSPFHVQADEAHSDRPLADVRADAMARAAEKLTPLKIDVPAEILALIGDGMASASGKTLTFSTPACCGPGKTNGEGFTLTLETHPAKFEADYCAGMQPVGYALTLTDGSGTRDLHRDGDTLPRSRGCTLDYRLYAVVRPFAAAGPRAAIISSYPFGFEGPDRRFLAVPVD
jgi:predicted secreted protein